MKRRRRREEGTGCCTFIFPLLRVPVYLYTALLIFPGSFDCFSLSLSFYKRQEGGKKELKLFSFGASGRGQRIYIYNRHIALCSASQAFGCPPPPSPPHPPPFFYSSDPSPLPSLPPPRSSSIDAGSHTCHLSLLIMHGRCC